MNNFGNMINRGALIILEGCDKSGKSSQSIKLVESLISSGIDAKHMSFPDRQIPSGKLINSYLTNQLDIPDESIHLLFSVNRWELKNTMKKLLEAGTTLIVDRYSYSGVAYSAAKGMDLQWCKNPEIGLIKPDLVLYLKASIDELIRRGDFGSERYEKKEFQEKVGQIFEQIYQQEQNYWLEVDASLIFDEVHKILLKESITTIRAIKDKPLELLWK